MIFFVVLSPKKKKTKIINKRTCFSTECQPKPRVKLGSAMKTFSLEPLLMEISL